MKKLTIAFAALLLLGSAFFSGNAFGRVAPGVTVEGVPVGGMRFEEAARTAKEALRKKNAVLVRSPVGTFRFDTGDYRGILPALKRAKSNEAIEINCRAWADMEEDLRGVCALNARGAANAEFTFSADGFTYYEGRTGISCDYHKLLSDGLNLLQNGGGDLYLEVNEYEPPVTLEEVKALTAPLARFSTCYDGQNAARAGNIALAASRISGTVLQAGEEFSFNKTVGERTRENGFEIAAVIQDGEFLPGVGGGVCQASTTLFNAALLAGMTVSESHPHSLSVGYVAPSLDAMVSLYSDLKFVNPYKTPVYILAAAEEGEVTFCLYGLKDGYTYRTESVILCKVAPPPPKTAGGEGRVIRAEREGMVSESYLITCLNGEEVKRELVRRDRYAPVQGIIAN